MTSPPTQFTLCDAAWRTSMRSQTSNCVEVAPLGGCRMGRSGQRPAAAVAVRDSKDRGGPVLVFARTQWSDFIAGVRAHEFDPVG